MEERNAQSLGNAQSAGANSLSPGDRAQRNRLVAEYHAAYSVWRQSEASLIRDPSARAAWQEGVRRMQALEAPYLMSLPVMALARCPYTGQVVTGRVDAFGTGGPWWMDADTVREPFQGPATLFAVDGALGLRGTPEDSPFSVQPGPDKPFVIPVILSRPEMRAVMLATEIEQGTIWWTAYFAWPPVLDQARVNDFARDCYEIRLDSGTGMRYADTYPLSLMDFDLTPWIRSGKLLWIAPDDPLYKLHATAEGCPYLGIRGEGRKQLIQGSWRGWLDTLREPVETGAAQGLDPEMEARFHKGVAFMKGEGGNG